MSENLTPPELAGLRAIVRGEKTWPSAPDDLLKRVLKDHLEAGRWVQVALVALMLWERQA